jgi:glycosyltransferase involved in cell wall biosynthesis
VVTLRRSSDVRTVWKGNTLGDRLVSVVVPTRNNQRTIEACLRSARDQSHDCIELIVVDNASSDGTVEIARGIADTVVTAGPERSAQRNAGLSMARGPWFLWLDSDMILPPDAIATALRTAERHDAAGVALPERTIGEGFWTACRALERSCYLDEPWLHNPRLLRTEYLKALGGFHLGMSGPEDADLRLRILGHGDTIVLASVIVDHDEGRLTLRDVMRKRFYYGRSIPNFAAEHEGGVRGQGSAVVRSYLRHRRQFLADPAHALGLVGLRAMEAAAYSAGAIRGRRDRRAGARSGR